jgi:hypothetical protein
LNRFRGGAPAQARRATYARRVSQSRRRRRDDERERDPDPARARAAAEPALDPVAAVRDAQRLYGNHAVSRVLARDPNPALEQKRTVRPPKPKLRSGREVDAIFDTSPYFKDLVAAKMKKITLEKAMKLDDAAAFERAWVEYAMRSYNPDTKQTYTEEEAKRYLAIKGVRAFQDEDRGEIHIRKEGTDLGTQLHEGLHLFCDDRWKRHMNYAANEGVTEYFTRKLGPEVGVERDDSSFLREYTSATHLVAAADDQTVAAAYFQGDIAGLKQKIDGRKPDGAGTWQKWLGFLEANDFKGANALLK